MFVYCIRHGESETNRDGKWTGWNNPLLTEKGEADAKKAGEIIKNVKFNAQQTNKRIIPYFKMRVKS